VVGFGATWSVRRDAPWVDAEDSPTRSDKAPKAKPRQESSRIHALSRVNETFFDPIAEFSHDVDLKFQAHTFNLLRRPTKAQACDKEDWQRCRTRIRALAWQATAT
jgi:hypothetical protein